MAWTTILKGYINRGLEPLNLTLSTLTEERTERARLLALDEIDHFEKPYLPILPQFAQCDPQPVLDGIARHRGNLHKFNRPCGGSDYSYQNEYFSSPDAEVAYVMVRDLRPKCIIEVGSGNSTRLMRAAIKDGEIDTRVHSIDPEPRANITAIADEIIPVRAEAVPASFFRDRLGSGDILFIDSSHEVCVGNDVVALLLNILPSLGRGVVVHIHDIFLPFDYPREWVIEHGRKWNEQYLVQALLQGSSSFEVIWPGYFLQKSVADFDRCFVGSVRGLATSLWLRKIA